MEHHTPTLRQPGEDTRRIAAATASTGLAHMLNATRLLLGAWDATLSNWDSTSTGPPPLPTDPAACTATLSVQMLDGFQMWVDARPVQGLPHGKARALLIFLLLNRRRPLSRARLCSLFWPEAEPGAARNSLHVTLHRLRQHLHEPTLLHHGDDGYQIRTAGEAWIDAEQFALHAEMAEQEDCAGHAQEAMTHYELAAMLYRTDLVDGHEADPALMAHSQALRDRLNQVLERLSCLREERGDWHGCLRVTLRHLELDECNEAAHRRLMRCYARLGQPRLAERQYRSCEHVLARLLGLQPSDATRVLFRQITARQGV